MLKFFLTKLLFIFLLAPSVSMAYNSMCYSPVQVSALLSKPKKSGVVSQSSLSRLKANIRTLENALDDAEGDLQDSLDKDKLKEKASSVAGKTRDYIEDEQDGWDCAKGGMSLFFFPSVIPQAYAEDGRQANTADSGSGDGDRFTDELNQLEVDVVGSGDSNEGSDSESDSDSGKSSGSSGVVVTPEAPKSSGSSGVVVPPEPPRAPAPITSPEAPESLGSSGVVGTTTVTPNKSEGSPDVVVTPEAPEAPEAEDSPEAVVTSEPATPTAEEICKATNKYWNKTAQKCCPNSKQSVFNNQCVSLSEKKCLESGGSWNGSYCQCPNDKPQLVAGYCKACPADKPLFKNGQCREKPEDICKNRGLIYDPDTGGCVSPSKKPCVDSGGSWDDDEGCQCPATKPQLVDGVCKACPSNKPRFSGGQCRACLGNTRWDSQKNRCVTPPAPALKDKQKCNNLGQNWNAQANECCPQGQTVYEGQCVSLLQKKCLQSGGTWDGSCKCPTGKPKLVSGKCTTCPAGQSWRKGSCVPCPDWKKNKAFKPRGKVSSSFCDDYAKDAEERECKRALTNLQRRAKQLNRLRDQLESLEDKLLDSQLNPKKESVTEASGLCFDCLKRVINASKPSAGQAFGKTLGVLAGAGFSLAGYKVGQTAQHDANMLRIQQGYPAVYDGFPLTGVVAGYPFMANNLYGLTRANTPVGGWSCSPSFSPYGHTYSHSHGNGHQMRYY